MIFGYALVVGIPLVALILLWTGAFEAGRKLRRRHTPDCGALHSDKLYRPDGGPTYGPHFCNLPQGHEGTHRVRDSSGTTHDWSETECSYWACVMCRASHPGELTMQDGSRPLCTQIKGHSGDYHSVKIGYAQSHVWWEDKGCRHKLCTLEVAS